MGVMAKDEPIGARGRDAVAQATPGGMRRLAAKVLSRLADSLHREEGETRHAQATGRCSLEALLRAYLARGADCSPARLFLVSFQDIRVAFGDEWDRVGPKVMTLADEIISETLPAGNCYSYHSDDTLLIMVVEREAGLSKMALSRVLEQLRRRFGGGTGGACGVKLKAATLSEVLRVQHPRAISAAPASSGQAAVTVQQMTPAQLAERIHKQIAFVHRPVWSAEGQEVGSFLCMARRSADYGTFFGKWVLNGGYDDPFAFGVDLRSMDTVLGALPAARALPRAPALVLPLHFRSLVGESGERIMRALASRVEEADRKHLVFEVLGPLETLPLTRLPLIVAALRKLGAAVWVRAVHTKIADLLPYLRGVDAFGIDLNDLARGDPDPGQRSRYLNDLRKVVPIGNAKMPGLYVWDVRTAGEVKTARAAGAGMLAGPAVMGDLDAPKATVGIAERDLLGHRQV